MPWQMTVGVSWAYFSINVAGDSTRTAFRLKIDALLIREVSTRVLVDNGKREVYSRGEGRNEHT